MIKIIKMTKIIKMIKMIKMIKSTKVQAYKSTECQEHDIEVMKTYVTRFMIWFVGVRGLIILSMRIMQ